MLLAVPAATYASTNDGERYCCCCCCPECIGSCCPAGYPARIGGKGMGGVISVLGDPMHYRQQQHQQYPSPSFVDAYVAAGTASNMTGSEDYAYPESDSRRVSNNNRW